MINQIANSPSRLPSPKESIAANELCEVTMDDLLREGSRQSIDNVLAALDMHYRAVPAKVLQVARRAHRCALRMGYTRGVAAALHYEGHAQAELGQFVLAASILKRCISAAKRARESEIVRRASRMLINCEFQCDCFDSAARRCIAFAKTLEHPNSSDDGAWVMDVMGLALGRARQFERALILFEHAHTIRRKLNSPNQFRDLLYIGICQQHRGEYASAQIAFSQSLKGFIELNDQFNQCVCLARLGLNQAYCGSYAGTRNLLTESAELAHRIGGCYLIAEHHVIAGLAHLEMAMNDDAKAHFEKGLESATGVLSEYHLQLIHESLATLHSQKSEWETAYKHIERAHAYQLKLVRMAGSPELERAFHAVASSFTARINKRGNAALGVYLLEERASPISEKTCENKPQITDRESQVLQQLAEGCSNMEIALHLGISQHTVRFHLVSIYSKLGARRRSDAVAIALREKLIDRAGI
jgi:DNA-binding CsgD family transcriptional regulator